MSSRVWKISKCTAEDQRSYDRLSGSLVTITKRSNKSGVVPRTGEEPYAVLLMMFEAIVILMGGRPDRDRQGVWVPACVEATAFVAHDHAPCPSDAVPAVLR